MQQRLAEARAGGLRSAEGEPAGTPDPAPESATPAAAD
jgi:hypothetical protein